jgi:transketolase
MLGWDLDGYAARFRAFGWHTVSCDGHDLEAIEAAFTEAAATTGSPTAILARTRKGRGVAAVEDQPGKHGKPLPDADAAIAELGGHNQVSVRLKAPSGRGEPHRFPVTDAKLPSWALGEQVATRQAYGHTLAALGRQRPDIVALDGEVSNSTQSELFAQAHPDRYFEMFIAEQQMIAAAVGMQARGWTPFVSTFGAFLTRAYDFIRMAAVSRANLRLCGSHAGVSIGQDGPSQMALEDMAALRAVHGSAVLHPSDANQTARLVAEMADRPGISYLRTLRGKTAVRTLPEEDIHIGGSRVVHATDNDDVTIVACGATVEEAERAAKQLGHEWIRARVIDCYSVKPIDTATLTGGGRGHTRHRDCRRPLARRRPRRRGAQRPGHPSPTATNPQVGGG